MNTPPSRAGSRWIWRKAKGCFARGRRRREYLHHVAAQRTAHNVIIKKKNTLGKRIHFYLCQISLSAWTLDFSVATVQSKINQQHTFSYGTSFICTNLWKIKNKEKVCGSEGRTSVTNCGKRKKQSECLQKKGSVLIHNVNVEKKNKQLTTF